MLVVVACTTDDVHDFKGRLVAHSLPQTCYQPANDRRRERGTHAAGDGATTADDTGWCAYSYYIGLHATILSRSHTAVGCNTLCLVVRDSTNSQDVVGIGRDANLLPRPHATVAR